MIGEMNILDSTMHVISVGAALDYRAKGIKMLKIQPYFQIHLAEETYLHNRRDPLFGEMWTGGEVYCVGITVTTQL